MASVTVEKGNKGVAAAIGKLAELGFNVSLPVGEGLRYDLIAERQGKCLRVQVKSMWVHAPDVLKVRCVLLR